MTREETYNLLQETRELALTEGVAVLDRAALDPDAFFDICGQIETRQGLSAKLFPHHTTGTSTAAQILYGYRLREGVERRERLTSALTEDGKLAGQMLKDNVIEAIVTMLNRPYDQDRQTKVEFTREAVEAGLRVALSDKV